jgi:hypothetical protein
LSPIECVSQHQFQPAAGQNQSIVGGLCALAKPPFDSLPKRTYTLSEGKEGKLHGLPFRYALEAVIVLQNQIIGLGYRTDVLFGHDSWGSDVYGRLGFGTAQRLTPVDVVTSVPPALLLNYTTGHSGSFFTLSGWNFTPNSAASLVVNGRTLTTTLAVNPTGGFILFLDTAGANDGFYVATAAVNPSASIRFNLDANEPSRIQEGGGPTFQVPAGIAYTYAVYLPLVQR